MGIQPAAPAQGALPQRAGRTLGTQRSLVRRVTLPRKRQVTRREAAAISTEVLVSAAVVIGFSLLSPGRH